MKTIDYPRVEHDPNNHPGEPWVVTDKAKLSGELYRRRFETRSEACAFAELPDYEKHDPKGWCGDPSRGAALGRGTYIQEGVDKQPLYVQAVETYGGYDRNGTYFGHGDTLFWFATAGCEVDFVMRAAPGQPLQDLVPEECRGLELIRVSWPLGYSDAELLQGTDDGEECPLCMMGTVSYEGGEAVCMGECGATVPLEPVQQIRYLRAALHEFTDAVLVAGGVGKNRVTGLYEPAADPEWVDIGEAYVNACRVLGIPAKVEKEEED